MENNLTFDKILAICSKENVSGVYCYETKDGIKITDISQLNENNSNYISFDHRIQKNYEIISCSIISLNDYKCRFNGNKINSTTSAEKIMLVWTQKSRK